MTLIPLLAKSARSGAPAVVCSKRKADSSLGAALALRNDSGREDAFVQ